VIRAHEHGQVNMIVNKSIRQILRGTVVYDVLLNYSGTCHELLAEELNSTYYLNRMVENNDESQE